MCGPGVEPMRVSSAPEKDADLTQHDLENALKNVLNCCTVCMYVCMCVCVYVFGQEYSVKNQVLVYINVLQVLRYIATVCIYVFMYVERNTFM